MYNKPEIFAKASFSREQIEAKEKLGADGIELQLMGEMIIDRTRGEFRSAEDAYDMSLLIEHEIRVVHSPLVKGMGDITLERMADDVDGFLLDQVFLIAEAASRYHGRNVPVIVHTEEFYDRLNDMGDSWNRIVEKVDIMLHKYPHTELLIENVSPLRDIGEGKELHLSNNFSFDNVLMVKKLREQLMTDRIGTVLDTCHQMLAEKYITAIYQLVADVPAPDLSIGQYFQRNKDVIKLVHLCDMAGSGYGKGRHGILFHAGTYGKLCTILKAYHTTGIDCPLTLEVEEDDYTVCDNYKITKEQVTNFYAGASRGFEAATSQLACE